MKISVPTLKPRNHLVAVTLKRKAGFHQTNRRVARKDDRKLNG